MGAVTRHCWYYYCLLLGLLCASLCLANTEKCIFAIPATQTEDGLQPWVERLSNDLSWPVMVPKHTGLTNRMLFPFPPERLGLPYFNPLVVHSDPPPSNANLTGPHALEHWYILAHLAPGRSYEARVSYPASSPTDFKMEIVELDQFSDYLPLATPQEIVASSTQSDPPASDDPASSLAGRPDGVTRFLRVRALYAGFSHIQDRDKQPVYYNIVLEQLYFYIPYQAYKLAVAIVGAVLFAVFVFNPLATRMILALRDKSKLE
ncbi:hypothetical protein BJ085DRAFT_37352 [Dimargaris cristalligena]|uniref:Uncharacterized protein n=1 Tax=Dimargaris cristalligena TaxID=215637 RepID=A0A4V1J5L8_9FUNG|nr:hypothetical protein BJ085DRAFT_37352 [Dimargaris cristalligena]|eukprot:RKP39509.1 hypothetical protein BJ085DRAFT_37352 [Dimargaris cristalligena]